MIYFSFFFLLFSSVQFVKPLIIHSFVRRRGRRRSFRCLIVCIAMPSLYSYGKLDFTSSKCHLNISYVHWSSALKFMLSVDYKYDFVRWYDWIGIKICWLSEKSDAINICQLVMIICLAWPHILNGILIKYPTAHLCAHFNIISMSCSWVI